MNETDTLGHFGPYRAVGQIGSGGMATIFAAVDGRLGQRVAIKRLHPHIAARPGAAERFLREGRAAARIRHPHVVQIVSVGTAEGTPYLVMELLEGCDLGAVLARKRTLGVEEALEIALPVLAGVAAAHDAGVVHRDLKPSNVFLASGPRARVWPKVLDFGVSKILDAEGDGIATATDGIIGTAAYMAPEQARAARNASFSSDQYALGILLYECLTGTLPFATGSVYDLLVAIMTAPLEPPGRRVPGIPAGLDAAVLRATSRDPLARYPSVRAFGEALLAFANERVRAAWAMEMRDAPVEFEVPDSSRERSAAWAGREPEAAATAGPTAQDTRSASKPPKKERSARRAAALLALGALVAGWTAWRAPGPSRAGETPVQPPIPSNASEPPIAAEPARTPTELPVPTTLTASAGVESAPPRPSAQAIAMPGRVVPARSIMPARAASSISAAAPPTSSPPSTERPVFGDNGSPIIP
jgi:eukaryotic-like serine/threonine-protein kinase